MSNDNTKQTEDRMAHGYDRMLGRVKEGLGNDQPADRGRLGELLDYAREKAVELDELSREEADKIGRYLERDLKEAARYLSETGEELRQWFRFDLELIEDRLLEAFVSVADNTRVELERWREQAHAAEVYGTGEMTGPGTIACVECGKELHFHKPGHIPPCPACGKTRFVRRFDAANDANADN